MAAAQKYYDEAVALITKAGRWQMAGKLYKGLAEAADEEERKYDDALIFYQKAEEMFALDEFSKGLTSQVNDYFFFFP
jgi:tetratricopeptide (TPR) repeat protein